MKRVQQLSLGHRYKCIEGGFAYQECNRKYVVQAVPESSFDSEPHTSNPQIILHSVKDFLATLCTLSYPYAMIGLVSLNFFNIILINNSQMIWLILNSVY